MRWVLAMVVGIEVLVALKHLWPWLPAIGLAAGWGYFCGSMRWRKFDE